jgi:hypothetical protein
MRVILAGSLAVLAALARPGRAQELDALLPAGVPGYGDKFNVIATHKQFAPGATGWEWNGVTLAPSLGLASGYDSAPNGSSGSALLTAMPSLMLTDPVAGFGAYAQVNEAAYPNNTAQNNFGATFAGGERIELPRETITLSAAYAREAETGFAINTVAVTKPLIFTVKDFRASDEITAGMFTLKPEFSATFYAFPDLAMQNRSDDRETLTLTYSSGGPLTYALRLHATQSDYRVSLFSTNTEELLAGVEDKMDGLWTLSALAGIARRVPHFSPSLTAPVLEARLDWMPTGLDRVSLSVVHEIDDPDEVSATPYTLTQAKFTLSHEYMENITFKTEARISRADYLHSPLRETLFTGRMDMQWHLNPRLALNGDYTFNDRQANYLSAANEHVLTLGLSWTP